MGGSPVPNRDVEGRARGIAKIVNASLGSRSVSSEPTGIDAIPVIERKVGQVGGLRRKHLEARRTERLHRRRQLRGLGLRLLLNFLRRRKRRRKPQIVDRRK